MDYLVKPYRSAAGASFGGGGTIFIGVWGGAPSTQTFYFILLRSPAANSERPTIFII